MLSLGLAFVIQHYSSRESSECHTLCLCAGSDATSDDDTPEVLITAKDASGATDFTGILCVLLDCCSAALSAATAMSGATGTIFQVG